MKLERNWWIGIKGMIEELKVRTRAETGSVRTEERERGREGNSSQRKGITELSLLLLPTNYKWAQKVVEIFKGKINLKVKRMSFKKKLLT